MANAATRASRRPAPDELLVPTVLLQSARDATGLDDFGSSFWMPALEALCATYRESIDLSERAMRAEHRRLQRLLNNRLRIMQVLGEHPEIEDISLGEPLILTGFPRTGTSALFNLLGANPTHRPLLLWEGNHPDPLDPPVDGPDPRMLALASMLERARQAAPAFAAIHEARADGPEECVQLMAHSIAYVQQGFEPLFEPYRSAFFAQDMAPVYEEYATFLRLLQWQRPGERWLLKTPAHLWGLDAIRTHLPGTRVVFTHRDPLRVVASYCSMLAALMQLNEPLNATDFGPRVLDYLARSMDRALDDREAGSAPPIVDVRYKDFVADPLRCIDQIHEELALPLDPTTRQHYERHIADHPQNKHGRHRYDLETFGLTEAQVRRALARYYDTFGDHV